MNSRCPSCGSPAPDEVRQCPACGWDFVTNKKMEKASEPPKAAEPPKKTEPVRPPSSVKPSAPVAGPGLALPPARGGGAPSAKIPKTETPPGENPFALPVARNLGSKPAESMFAPPPAFPEDKAKLPAVAPKEPPTKEPPTKSAEPPKKASAELTMARPADIQPPPPKPAPVAAKEEAIPEAESDFLLPSSTDEIVVKPAAKPAPKAETPKADSPKVATPTMKAPARAPEPEPAAAGPKQNADRKSAAMIAGAAGAALGIMSLGALWMMTRSDPAAATHARGSSPFGKRSASDTEVKPSLDIAHPPAPAPAPAPQAVIQPRATATFARPTAAAVAAALAAAKPKPKPAPQKPTGPQWVFEGVVYDLLTTRGVFGVKLVFIDAEDNEVTTAETSEGGKFHATMPAGPAAGYTLHIVHDDYSGKHIDELDSTSSVRKADLEQRKFLMRAGARSLPWVGAAGKTVRRDMALVPKNGDD